MKIFDSIGRMRIPKQKFDEQESKKEPKIIRECYCPNGHILMNENTKFNKHNAITILLKRKKEKGLLFLSPICGDKNRVTMDINIISQEIINFHCPECNIELGSYAPCHCGGNLKILFCTPELEYNHFLGICNREGCSNAVVKKGEELYSCLDIN